MPKPQTVALAYVDAEFGVNVCEGARANAKASGFKIVYDKNYPPATVDFAPVVRAIAAANPDLVAVCSYPLDTVGIIKAIHEMGFKPKMLGGGMVGLQSTALKAQLGPLLNGIVNFETWMPVKGAEILRRGRVSGQISGAREDRRHRRARLLSGDGLCRPAGARRRRRRHQEPR